MKFASRHVASISAGLMAVAVAGTAFGAAPSPEPVVPDRLDLRSAIGFALANNYTIREARERIKQQE
ncbi:MAG TPA: TolC family protein, partial [Opitutaceae bacterium]|nr:TolC family protein [Opitutaceae bacterium]